MKEIFETERLLVRELVDTDWPDFLEMNTTKEVMLRIGEGKIKTEADERSGFDNLRANYRKGTGLGVWAVVRKSDAAFIGAASITPLGITSEVQLGYRLKKQYWRQGYGTEIARALVEYGFTQMHLDRITATTNLDNDVSRRVLEKAGLRFEESIKYDNWPMNYFVIYK